MKKNHTAQHSLFDFYPEHQLGNELKFISEWLDKHPDLIDWVKCDISNICKSNAGREAITAETILRCAILMQTRQLTYEELEFSLIDSQSCQTFVRLDKSKSFPKKSALQGGISRISDVTWEVIHLQLLDSAKTDKFEKGDMLRIDSTVTDSNIHDPTDSSLLWDSVRTMIRLLENAEELTDETIPWVNHKLGAKRKAHAIFNTKGQEAKVPLYKNLLNFTHKTLGYIEIAEEIVRHHSTDILMSELWCSELAHYKPLILNVIDQTERRVLQGENVPAAEKIFSIFEEHTDIIIKGARDIQYGHKLNLCSGKSGLILDVVIETGNPADTSRFLPMLERHKEHYGQVPRQCAADGGYACQENVKEAKSFGVEDVAFNKKRGIAIEDMAKSNWVYRKLKNFRAGIEANISTLKRAWGLSRCAWKGWEHFNSYIWSSVVSYNLTLFSRLSLEQA